MKLKVFLLLISYSIIFLSCWKLSYNHDHNTISNQPKVWGYKPVYGVENNAKKVIYTSIPQKVIRGGNIYAFGNYIFQIDPGSGVHVFDNSVPSQAKRIGFITVKGCSEMSIKGDKLYTNSYDDLVVLDISNLDSVKEYSRLKGIFTEYRYGSPISEPPTSGWYECPASDSLVIGWVRDSVFQRCYKE